MTRRPETDSGSRNVEWIAFPDDRVKVCGLPWFGENQPGLMRLPKRAEGTVPAGVWNLAQFPGGGRIRFASDTSQLHIRAVALGPGRRGNRAAAGASGLDVYVDGRYWSTVCVSGAEPSEATFFVGAGGERKEITVYLPLFQELSMLAVGVDDGARVEAPASFARVRPYVLYGSSVAQGSCAGRPGMSYSAILARDLGLDFVNLGFGGAGKAEAEVVELVAETTPCCWLFDLGKSYGRQDGTGYSRMIYTVRNRHPDVPVVCVTPIFSTRECYSAEYRELSEHTRRAMREAAQERIKGGDSMVRIVEGMDLLGPEDTDGLHEGVHPNDLGYTLIAERLRPVVGEAIGMA